MCTDVISYNCKTMQSYGQLTFPRKSMAHPYKTQLDWILLLIWVP